MASRDSGDDIGASGHAILDWLRLPSPCPEADSTPGRGVHAMPGKGAWRAGEREVLWRTRHDGGNYAARRETCHGRSDEGNDAGLLQVHLPSDDKPTLRVLSVQTDIEVTSFPVGTGLDGQKTACSKTEAFMVSSWRRSLTLPTPEGGGFGRFRNLSGVLPAQVEPVQHPGPQLR